MTLEHLWAGWRGEYVASAAAAESTGAGRDPHRAGVSSPAPEDASRADRAAADDDSPEAREACVFCRLAASGPPSADNGVVWVGAETFVVLNAYPYATGHLMVVPRRHVATVTGLTEAEGAEMWAALRLAVTAVETALRPDGMNLGANLGRAAGAGIPKHVHLHAVPRWYGDTNFMTAVGGTRVLPEALAVTWERLRQAWAS